LLTTVLLVRAVGAVQIAVALTGMVVAGLVTLGVFP
jgi:hypothetical protein